MLCKDCKATCTADTAVCEAARVLTGSIGDAEQRGNSIKASRLREYASRAALGPQELQLEHLCPQCYSSNLEAVVQEVKARAASKDDILEKVRTAA